MLGAIKNNNRNVAIKVVFLLLISTVFLVLVKSELIDHQHCTEENCHTCEIIYIVSENLKNVSVGSKTIKLHLPLIIYIYIASLNNCCKIIDNTLVDSKVRMDC